MTLPTCIVFASGEKEPEKGGSGFQLLVEASRDGRLQAEIVAVVSCYPCGGVFTKATKLKIPFHCSPSGRTEDDYKRLIGESGAQWVLLSGWLGHLSGHDPRYACNIHPALDLKRFGGKGMHGHHVHEAVWNAFQRREVTHTGVTMHFATAKYDDDKAIFFQRMIPIAHAFKNAQTLGRVVNLVEHQWQPEITNRVVSGLISWDGKDPRSIVGADIE